MISLSTFEALGANCWASLLSVVCHTSHSGTCACGTFLLVLTDYVHIKGLLGCCQRFHLGFCCLGRSAYVYGFLKGEFCSSLLRILSLIIPPAIRSLIRLSKSVPNSHDLALVLRSVTYWSVVSPISCVEDSHVTFFRGLQ